jgi:hypothetical protein
MLEGDDQSLATPTNPVDLAVMRDLVSARLLAAADDGRFGTTTYEFPIVIGWIAINAHRLVIRLDCTGYPNQAPAGCLWDLGSGLPLTTEHWPIGGRAETVFRKDWSPSNGGAPYLACDRIAINTHPDWPNTLVGRIWNPSRTIHDYLEQVSAALVGAHLPEETVSSL